MYRFQCPTFLCSDTYKGGPIVLTEIIFCYQTISSTRIWNQEILQFTVFLSAEKIVLMNVSIRLSTLQNTATSVSILPAEHYTGLKKTVTLKSKNLFSAEYSKRTCIRFTEGYGVKIENNIAENNAQCKKAKTDTRQSC